VTTLFINVLRRKGVIMSGKIFRQFVILFRMPEEKDGLYQGPGLIGYLKLGFRNRITF
jgi:hypothetical protein